MKSFLHISEAVSIAIHAMILVAVQEEKPTTQREIYSLFRVSENYLTKVMLSLRKQNLLKSLRGPSGGFLLVKSPSQITLLEIYEAIEGKMTFCKCIFQEPVCNFSPCFLGHFFHQKNTEIYSYFQRTTLKDAVDLLKKDMNS